VHDVLDRPRGRCDPTSFDPFDDFVGMHLGIFGQDFADSSGDRYFGHDELP
jgi:hypothetical protein